MLVPATKGEALIIGPVPGVRYGDDSPLSVRGRAAAGTSQRCLGPRAAFAAAPGGTVPSFYRASSGAEIDLLLELPGRRKPWAIEIKRGLAPKVERGFHAACEVVRPERRRVVYGGRERFAIAEGVEAVPLIDPCEEIAAA